MKLTIIGCGHGGQTLAADLTQRSCEVTLYAHPSHPGGIHAIAKKGGINCTGIIQGFVKIAKITTDLSEALDGSQYIFIALPSFAHEAIFTELLSFIKPKQTIITLAANFASLVYLRLLTKANKVDGIEMIDTASLPYVCRADNNGTVEIIAVKKILPIASIPAAAIEKHIHILAPFLPCKLEAYKDVLSLGMNIISGLIHPAITLFNAGRIGKGKEIFYFYRDGITPEIASIIERLDKERINIGKSLGLKMHTYLEMMRQYYDKKYSSIYQFFRESTVHNVLPLCPASLQERYITQDVANVLVPWYCLGQFVQTETLVLNNLINLAGLFNKTDYLDCGTNLKKLNLHDKTIDQIKMYINTGKLTSNKTRGEISNQLKQINKVA